MVRTKVFVGNLDFKTKEADLAEEFRKAGNKVVGANIITRRSRSLGYGFVELESEEEAKKAVATMNNKHIDDRDIKVEVAKPRQEPPPQKAPAAPVAASTTNDQSSPNARRRPRRQPRRANNAPSNTNANAGATANNTNNGAPAATQAAGGNADSPKRFRRAPRRQQAPAAQNGVAANGTQADTRPPRAPRREPKPRQPQEQTPRVQSKTSLFVANLPFEVDDARLSKIFADSGVPAKSAHVVIKRNGRSKGFGFVEFDTVEAQTNALTAVDKLVVDGRPLTVKVALTENPTTEAAPAAAPTKQ